jgi:hypothetical protein
VRAHGHVDDRRAADRAGRRRSFVALVALLAATAVTLVAPVSPAAAGPAEDTAFVRAVHVDLVDREPTAEQLTYYAGQLADGRPRWRMAGEIAYGIENITQEITEIYEQALGRVPDDDGVRYWVNMTIYAHNSFAWVNARVYGSSEYVNAHAAAPEPWVQGVFADMLGRSPDPAGLAYWTHVAATKGPVFAAYRLYQSPEHRRTRVTEVFQEMFGRAPEPEALDFWSGQLRLHPEDLWLAMRLAATPEYGARAVARFP